MRIVNFKQLKSLLSRKFFDILFNNKTQYFKTDNVMINNEEQNFVIPGFYCSNISLEDSNSDSKEIIRVMGEFLMNNKSTGRYQLADGTTKSEDDILANYTYLSKTNNKNKEEQRKAKLNRLMGDFEPVSVDAPPQPYQEIKLQPQQQSIYRDVSGEIGYSPFAPNNFSDNVVKASTTIENYADNGQPHNGIITNKDLEDYINERKDMMFVKRQDYIGVPFHPQIEDFEISVLKKYETLSKLNLINLHISTPINYEFKNMAKAIGFMNLNTDTISEYIVNQLLTSKYFCISLKTALIQSLNDEINHEINHEKMIDSIKQVNDKLEGDMSSSISNDFVTVRMDMPDFEIIDVDNVFEKVKSATDFPSTIQNPDYVKENKNDIVIENTYQEVPVFTKEQITKINEIDSYLKSLL